MLSEVQVEENELVIILCLFGCNFVCAVGGSAFVRMSTHQASANVKPSWTFVEICKGSDRQGKHSPSRFPFINRYVIPFCLLFPIHNGGLFPTLLNILLLSSLYQEPSLIPSAALLASLHSVEYVFAQQGTLYL